MTWRGFLAALAAGTASGLSAARIHDVAELCFLWAPLVVFGVYGLVAVWREAASFPRLPVLVLRLAGSAGVVAVLVLGAQLAFGLARSPFFVAVLVILLAIVVMGLPFLVGRKRSPFFVATLAALMCAAPTFFLTWGELPWLLGLRG